MKFRCKCLRIHHETDNDTISYELYDRYAGKSKILTKPIEIFNLPPIKRFGYCPIGSDDITLEFEKEVILNIRYTKR